MENASNPRGGNQYPNHVVVKKKKKNQPTRERPKPRLQQMPRQTLPAASPAFPTGSLFFPCPSCSTTSRNRHSRAGAVDRGGSCAPRRPRPRRHSPEPLDTSDGSGRGLAASREPRGQTGSGCGGRGRVSGTSSPLAVASEHLSGAPSESERRGEGGRAAEGGRGAELSRAAPSAGLSPRAPRAPARAPGPAARPPASGPTQRAPAPAVAAAARPPPSAVSGAAGGALHCSAAASRGWAAGEGGRCRHSCRGGLTTQSDPGRESDADPGTARGGCGAPSTAGCGRAGTSSARTRSRPAPGASCVTMDISLLAAPSSHSERPPAAEAAAWLLRRRPGDQLAAAVAAAATAAAVTAFAAAGERRSRKRGKGRSGSIPGPLRVSTQ